MRKTIGLFLCCLVLCLAAFAAQAAGNSGPLSVLALGPADGRAVVQYHGKMHVVHVGDKVPGTRAKVVQVLPGKLVAEQVVGSRKHRRRVTLWIFRASKPGAASRIERLNPRHWKVRPAAKAPRS